MRIIQRQIEDVCRRDLETFPVLTVTGPRQSGKSTLLRKLLPEWAYVNLEDGESLQFAATDPKGFLKQYADQCIIDEIQRSPQLLSQIQVKVDDDRRPGRFAVSGSNNLLLLESISQSLAGRTAVRNLLPFSYGELAEESLVPDGLELNMYRGGYPPVHQAPTATRTWLDSYIQTYVERDVRLIRNVTDLALFRRFLRLCAGRVGQLFDATSLGNDLGASHNTVRDWLNLLETSFVAFRLQPYFRNFSKRIIKSAKIYFYDTGLLCRLLDIRDADQLVVHPFRGAIFENWCITEALKSFYNRGEPMNTYFWRDRSFEVDLLLSTGSRSAAAIEIKSGQTLNARFIEAATKLQSLAAEEVEMTAGVVYGGDQTQKRSTGTFFSWRDYGVQIAKGQL